MINMLKDIGLNVLKHSSTVLVEFQMLINEGTQRIKGVNFDICSQILQLEPSGDVYLLKRLLYCRKVLLSLKQ